MPADLAFLPSDPRQVDEVIGDVDLMESDVCIHYVVDPFEIQSFCFPAEQAHSMEWPWSEAMNNVVALWEVFYGHSNKPIILDEYKYELLAAIRHNKTSVDKGLRLTRELDSKKSLSGGLEMGGNFIAALAVAMGLYGEGFQRLRHLLDTRLVPRPEEDNEDAAILSDCFARQPQAPPYAVEVAVAAFMCILADYRLRRRKEMPARRRHLYKSSILVDAQAICRLLEIQRLANRLLLDGKLRRKQVFQYVSSAARTDVLLDVLRTRSQMQGDADWPVLIWRSPRQILLRLVCASSDVGAAREKLRRFRDIVAVSGGAGRLDDSSLPIDLRPHLEAYRSTIDGHYERVRSYGLSSLLSTGARFHELLGGAREQDWIQGALSELKQLVEGPDWVKRSEELADLNLFYTSAKVSFANSMIQNLAEGARTGREMGYDTVRSGRDAVGGSRQHLPTLFRVSPANEYSVIVSDIKNFYGTPIHGRRGQMEVIRRACQAFLGRERLAERLGEDEIEHEFVRNLLLLALPPADADKFAFEHAREMIQRVEGLRLGTSDEVRGRYLGQYELEFRYLACWAARRQAEYARGERLATATILERGGDRDPRFYHARCLNSYSWLSDAKKFGTAKPAPIISIARAIEDASTAIELYLEWSPLPVDQVGALYNTVACLYVYRLDELYDLSAARQSLDRLKQAVDKTSWLDRFPEYFHTEAMIEYEEFKTLSRENAGHDELERKLRHASREIDFAFSMYEDNPLGDLKHRDEVKILRSQINESLVSLSVVENAPDRSEIS